MRAYTLLVSLLSQACTYDFVVYNTQVQYGVAKCVLSIGIRSLPYKVVVHLLVFKTSCKGCWVFTIIGITCLLQASWFRYRTSDKFDLNVILACTL